MVEGHENSCRINSAAVLQNSVSKTNDGRTNLLRDVKHNVHFPNPIHLDFPIFFFYVNI